MSLVGKLAFDNANNSQLRMDVGLSGGIVGLAAILFLGYRCTNRRFSDLDEDGGNVIRWPEILKRNEDETTTLNPLGTKRRDGVAGIGIEMDENSSVSDFNSLSHEKLFAAPSVLAPQMAHSRSASSSGSADGGVAAGAGPFYAGTPQGYCTYSAPKYDDH